MITTLIDAGLSALPNKAEEKEAYLLAAARVVFEGWCEYAAPHILDRYNVISVEKEFSFPLENPDSSGRSKTFVEAGKIDGVLQEKTSGIYRVLEHKTTSGDLAPESDYWLRLRMDTQISKYLISLMAEGKEVDGVFYDVMKRPSLRIANVPLLDPDGLKIVHDANGQRVLKKDGKPRQTADTELGYVLQSRPETPTEHGLRTAKKITEAPTDHYAQRDVTRLQSDLLEYMQDAWAVSQQILYFRNNNIWPRNPSACTEWGGCEFFQLCCGQASVDGTRFRKSTVTHPELEGDAFASGKELLTNSRMGALRKCARYHFHRYESPIEPCEEKSEALRFGTLLHTAMEAALKTQIKK